MMSETPRPLCQQILRVEMRSWQPVFECEQPARFTWVSDLRGKRRERAATLRWVLGLMDTLERWEW